MRFFHTSVFLSATIGIPFCIFKALFGYLALHHVHVVLGWTLIFWALLDLLMNLARAGMELARVSDPPIEFCSLAQIGRLVGRPRLWLTIDTFLSFSIICTALWSGWIASLPPWGSILWYLATTVNLMSLAVMNVWTEIFSPPEEEARS